MGGCWSRLASGSAGTETVTVDKAFIQEREGLLSLPGDDFPPGRPEPCWQARRRMCAVNDPRAIDRNLRPPPLIEHKHRAGAHRRIDQRSRRSRPAGTNSLKRSNAGNRWERPSMSTARMSPRVPMP